MNPEMWGRAPVQADRGIPMECPGHHAGTISWEEHLEAYKDYSNRYGSGQSAERLAERGGFGYAELVDHLGREPRTWRKR